MARIQVNDRVELEEGSVIESIARFDGRPDKLLHIIGLMTVAYAQKAFEDQAMDGKPWAPRMNPNIPGIINDVNAGRSPRPQRFTDRPALVDTGSLRLSIAHRVISADTVEVGSTHRAAAIHQLGLKSESPSITEAGQKALWQWMKRQGHGKAGSIRGQMARAREKAADRYSSRQEGIWKRATDLAVKNRLEQDSRYQRLRADEKRLLAGRKVGEVRRNDSATYAMLRPVRRELGQMRSEARARMARGGITNPEVRAAVEELRDKYRGDRDAAVSKARARRDDRMKALRQRQKANPLFDVAGQLGWLLQPAMVGATKTIRHPARPFLGVPKDLRREVEKTLGVIIGQVA